MVVRMPRLACLLAAAGALGASELAPSANLGAVPEIAPRTWFIFNFAPDDQAVAAQAPRRRETAIGASAPLDPGRGLHVHAEGVWSPVRAPQAEPPSRVDELRWGIGASIERPGDAFGWRLAATAGMRVLTDLGSAELDRGENDLFRGSRYRDEGDEEHPDSADPLLAARWTGLLRITDSDPLREKPIDLALGARAIRQIGLDGDGGGDVRVQATLMLPTRTTQSWFGLTWQELDQDADGSLALAAADEAESGWWFASGGALRLGTQGNWLVEIGSALQLQTGTTVGTLAVVRSGDPPRAAGDGTASIQLVAMRDEGLSAGIAAGDQLTLLGPAVLRSEIRTLVGDRSEPPGTDGADALRLDALLRLQLPLRIGSLVAIGPEAAFGLGVRRDAAEFPDQPSVAVNRVEAVGDVGLAGRVATGWTDGIAALEGAIGWGWWQALGGEERLEGGGVGYDLRSSGGGLIIRAGLMATF